MAERLRGRRLREEFRGVVALGAVAEDGDDLGRLSGEFWQEANANRDLRAPCFGAALSP